MSRNPATLANSIKRTIENCMAKRRRYNVCGVPFDVMEHLEAILTDDEKRYVGMNTDRNAKTEDVEKKMRKMVRDREAKRLRAISDVESYVDVDSNIFERASAEQIIAALEIAKSARFNYRENDTVVTIGDKVRHVRDWGCSCQSRKTPCKHMLAVKIDMASRVKV